MWLRLPLIARLEKTPLGGSRHRQRHDVRFLPAGSKRKSEIQQEREDGGLPCRWHLLTLSSGNFWRSFETVLFALFARGGVRAFPIWATTTIVQEVLFYMQAQALYQLLLGALRNPDTAQSSVDQTRGQWQSSLTVTPHRMASALVICGLRFMQPASYKHRIVHRASMVSYLSRIASSRL